MLPYYLFLIHCLCLDVSLIYSWLSNKHPQAIVNNPISLLYVCSPIFKNNRPFYINFDFCFEKRLFLKDLKNNFKKFDKLFFIVIVLYILRILLCVTNP